MTRIVMARKEHTCSHCGATIGWGEYCGQLGTRFECHTCMGIDVFTGKEPEGDKQ